MPRRLMRSIVIAAAVLAAGLALRLAAAPMPEAMEAALFALDVAAGERSSALKRLRAAPSRAAMEAAGEVSGDLYRPAAPPRAVLVLVPGASSEGKDHPQLVAFAASLARVGFAVFVPELPALRRLQV
ncbi:MAG: alpha/beta hydrolase, partial [Alphaproteobacteria bacterium]|nr:alpha/beta hydrolase [Alphaproteobacteria bacterium]